MPRKRARECDWQEDLPVDVFHLIATFLCVYDVMHFQHAWARHVDWTRWVNAFEKAWTVDPKEIDPLKTQFLVDPREQFRDLRNVVYLSHVIESNELNNKMLNSSEFACWLCTTCISHPPIQYLVLIQNARSQGIILRESYLRLWIRQSRKCRLSSELPAWVEFCVLHRFEDFLGMLVDEHSMGSAGEILMIMARTLARGDVTFARILFECLNPLLRKIWLDHCVSEILRSSHGLNNVRKALQWLLSCDVPLLKVSIYDVNTENLSEFMSVFKGRWTFHNSAEALRVYSSEELRAANT